MKGSPLGTTACPFCSLLKVYLEGISSINIHDGVYINGKMERAYHSIHSPPRLTSFTTVQRWQLERDAYYARSEDEGGMAQIAGDIIGDSVSNF
jgi:hypothetical protein